MKQHYIFGVVGQHIAYSKSPEIFKAIFSFDNTAGEMNIYNIEQGEFETVFRSLVTTKNIDGLSITIPYKEAVMPYLDSIDPVAKTVGAVNSVAVADGKTIGYNTDCYGFSVPLQPYRDRLQGSSALVIGYGGAARAVVYSLVTDFNVRTIHVTGRNRNKLLLFQRTMLDVFPDMNMMISELSTYNRQQQKKYAIVVNCTPLGGWNYQEQSVLPDGLLWRSVSMYYDLNYNNDNKSVVEAKRAGITTITGMPMLVAQAVRSYELWTGRNVSVADVMSLIISQE